MSYCRFASEESGFDRSDLYIFQHVDGYMTCCGCWLGERDYNTTDVWDMLDHINEHDQAGHVVPKGLRHDLVSDWPKEWMTPRGRPMDDQIEPVSKMDELYEQAKMENLEPNILEVLDATINELTEQRDSLDNQVRRLTDSNKAYQKRCHHYENQLSYYEKMVDALLEKRDRW